MYYHTITVDNDLETNMNHTQRQANELLTTEQVAQQLGVTAHCLRVWRATKKNLRFIRDGKHFIRYRQSDVDAYLESQTVSVNN